MKRTTKIRFTEPQIALVMRAHPNCNPDCWPSYHLNSISPEKLLVASAQSRTAGISITIIPVAASRVCTRRHAANSQLAKPAQRFCNFQDRARFRNERADLSHRSRDTLARLD
jgi:hypothetical protein